MTVIMALKRAGEIWLGSDTRITEGDYKVDYMSRMDSKLLFLENALIGAAGDLTMRNYLELFISKGENSTVPFSSKLDVIEFFIAFKKFLKRHAGLGDSDSNQVQGLHNTQWIIATRTQIFTLDQDGATQEYPDMCVIGSGTESARAVLNYMILFQPGLTTEKMLERAHEVTLQQNITCGGKQLRVNVIKELNRVK